MRRSVRYAITFLAVCLAAAGVSACGKGDGASPGTAAGKGGRGGRGPVPVSVAKARSADIPLELRTVGVVEAIQSAPVRSQVSGTVVEVAVREGSDVAAGDVLYRIDARPFAVAIRQLEANLQRDQAQVRNLAAQGTSAAAQVKNAEAQLRFAEEQERRYTELAAKDYVTREALDQRRAATETARASLDAARAAVEANRAGSEAAQAAVAATQASIEQARLQLEYTTVKAPVAGRAGSLQVKMGDLVRANDATPLLVINQLRPILVRFTLPEGEVPRVRGALDRGTLWIAVVPTGDDGVARRGQVVFLDNAVDPATGTIALKARFPNDDLALWPGSFADVTVVLDVERGVTVVPSAAVQTGQQGSYVYLIGADMTATLRPVTVSRAKGEDVVIAKGVAPGDTVVTDGQIRLTPGATASVRGEGDAVGGARTEGRPGDGAGAERGGRKGAGDRP